MRKNIDLRVGELALGSENLTMRTVGIGSCMVVAIYDKEIKIGGMLHSMLPSGKDPLGNTALRESDETVSRYRAKYVDESIKFLVSTLLKKGANSERLVAKITGGAIMLKSFDNGDSIGERNLKVAKETLAGLGVRIKGESTGGTVGRMAELNVANGILSVNIKI